MNGYNEEYYIAQNLKGGNTFFARRANEAAEQDYHKKIPSGEPPFFFHNSRFGRVKRERARKDGKLWPVTDVLMNGLDLLVKGYIRDELVQYPTKGLRFYPSVFIDDDGTWYEDYWFLDFHEKCEYWDKDQSDVLSINKNDHLYKAEIDKFCLDEKKLDAIPEETRLMFKMGGVNLSYIFCHQKIVDFFETNNIQGIRFFNVSQFEEGDQF